LIPLGDRVVILPDPVPELTNGLVRVHSNWAVPVDRGTVVSVGLGGWDEDGNRVAVGLGVGDRVVFTRVRGMQVTISSHVLVLVREVDVLATLPA
jgi:chaperonin GroES